MAKDGSTTVPDIDIKSEPRRWVGVGLVLSNDFIDIPEALSIEDLLDDISWTSTLIHDLVCDVHQVVNLHIGLPEWIIAWDVDAAVEQDVL